MRELKDKAGKIFTTQQIQCAPCHGTVLVYTPDVYKQAEKSLFRITPVYYLWSNFSTIASCVMMHDIVNTNLKIPLYSAIQTERH